MTSVLWPLLFTLIMFSLSGCGDKSEREIESVIIQARAYLTKGYCQQAIEAITSISYQETNPQFIKVYASAYACRAGFSMVRFFENDLEKIGDPSPLGGFASFALSSRMTEPRHESYEDLGRAVEALKYAGGLARYRNPTAGRRNQIFSPDDAREINSLLMYLSMSQFGQFLAFYGNTNTDGFKGEGERTNSCFLNYTLTLEFDTPIDPAPQTTLDDYFQATNSCDATGPSFGSPALGSTGSLNLARMCQGSVLFHVFLDTLDQVLDDLNDLVDLGDILDFLDLVDDAEGLALQASTTISETVLGITSQTVCEELNSSQTNYRDLQFFYALYFETLLEAP
jgi:hypothetical protein